MMLYEYLKGAELLRKLGGRESYDRRYLSIFLNSVIYQMTDICQKGDPKFTGWAVRDAVKSILSQVDTSLIDQDFLDRMARRKFKHGLEGSLFETQQHINAVLEMVLIEAEKNHSVDIDQLMKLADNGNVAMGIFLVNSGRIAAQDIEGDAIPIIYQDVGENDWNNVGAEYFDGRVSFIGKNYDRFKDGVPHEGATESSCYYFRQNIDQCLVQLKIGTYLGADDAIPNDIVTNLLYRCDNDTDRHNLIASLIEQYQGGDEVLHKEEYFPSIASLLLEVKDSIEGSLSSGEQEHYQSMLRHVTREGNKPLAVFLMKEFNADPFDSLLGLRSDPAIAGQDDLINHLENEHFNLKEDATENETTQTSGVGSFLL